MLSIDELFYREFTNLQQRLRAVPSYSVEQLPVPSDLYTNNIFLKKHWCHIEGIKTEYYKKLNGADVVLAGKVKLQKKKFDYKSQYIKNSDGSYVYEDVSCPKNCVAILSDRQINVPYSFQDKDFIYVDMLLESEIGQSKYKYVYIIPKSYCYRVNQTALVVTAVKLKKQFYFGMQLALQNGRCAYLYVIPYNPSNYTARFKVLCSKLDSDYTKEINKVCNYWLANNIIYNPNWCGLSAPIKGRYNLAVQQQDAPLDVYVKYNIEKTLGDEAAVGILG